MDRIFTYRLKFLLLILFTVLSLKTFAGIEVFNLRKSGAEVVSGAVFEITDDKFDYMQAHPDWNQSFANYRLTNRIILSADPLSNQTGNYTVTCSLRVYNYTWNGTGFQINPGQDVSLTVNYNGNGVAYKDKGIFQLPGTGGNKMIIQILSISTDQGNVSPSLILEGEVEVERYYLLNEAAPVPASALGYNDVTGTRGELEVYWDPIPGAEEYNLEWSYLSDYPSDPNKTQYAASELPVPSDLFRNNSTRVTTSKTVYQIPMIYERGYILFRVRGLGRKGQAFKDIAYGKWSYEDGTVQFVSQLPPNQFFVWNGHLLNLNWQSSLSFAERGKNKAAVGYFDGSFRNRQSVSRINSNDKVIIGETIYDHQGRGAIQVLPVPSLATKIGFTPGFNRSLNTPASGYSKKDFDLDQGTCNPGAGGMDPSSGGASNYYSPSNTNNSAYQGYAPDALNFPFTQTDFTPDNTGRIRRQSGVGYNHRLGSGHETRYFYGRPEQEELDRLFGPDAGYCDFYKKNAVKDANGQISVSYMDAAGKVVATALAGVSPSSMQPLSYNLSKPMKIDLLSKINPDGKEEKSLHNVREGNKLTYSRNVLVTTEGLRSFFYRMEGTTYSETCPFDPAKNKCYECVLEVDISLTDECGKEYLATGTAASGSVAPHLSAVVGEQGKDCPGTPGVFTKGSLDGNDWSTTDNGTNSAILPEGTYTLSKTLKVNKEALDYYTQLYFDPANACLKTLPDFRDDAVGQIDFSGCGITCEECKQKLGVTWEQSPYNKNFNAQCDPCFTQEVYNGLLAECQELCDDFTSIRCESGLDAMAIDMSPLGQYAEYLDVKTGANDPTAYPLSVLNPGNDLPRHSGYPANAIPYWRNPYNRGKEFDGKPQQFLYLDAYGQEAFVDLLKNADGTFTPEVDPAHLNDVVADPDDPNHFKVRPQFLNRVEDFITNFDPAWANALVAYHPEYGYYEYCQGNAESNNWDERLLSSDTRAEAVSNLGATYNDLLALDPFFVTGTDLGKIRERKAMERGMSHYIEKDGTVLTMWQAARLIASCPNYRTDMSCYSEDPCWGDALDKVFYTDQEWTVFRDLYHSLKIKIQEVSATKYAIVHTSYNGCIGVESFNPFQDNFLGSFYLSNIPFPSWFTLFRSSQYYNFSQPCNWYFHHLYSSKTARFPKNSQLLGSQYQLDATKCYDNTDTETDDDYRVFQCTEQNDEIIAAATAEAELAFYEKCGQCPMARRLQDFLDGMVEGDGANHLETTLNLSCNASTYHFVKEIEEVLGGSGVSTWNFISDVINGSKRILTVNLTQGSATCQLQLAMPKEYAFQDIKSICCLQYITNPLVFPLITNKNFNVTATFINTQGNQEEVTVEGYTSCIDVGNCVFPQVCRANQIATDIQSMFNALLYTSSADPAWGSHFTGSNIDLTQTPYTEVISNSLKNQGPAGPWKYSGVITDPTHMLATIQGNSSECDIRLSFVEPTPNYDFNDIISFSNIRLDQSTSDPGRNFKLTAFLIDYSGNKRYVDLKGSSPCFILGKCGTNTSSLMEEDGEMPYKVTDGTCKSGNMVQNGDFSKGYTGIKSDYNLFVAGGSMSVAAGSYLVGTDPKKYNTVLTGSDHTSQSGPFMILDGAQATGQRAWYQQIKVKPNTQYIFSAWACNVNSGNPFRAKLVLLIKGVVQGPEVIVPSTSGQWVQLSAVWNSGSNTSVEFAIQDNFAQGEGNDFGLDDIVVRELECDLIRSCGRDLITNGNFSAGYYGFTSDYTNVVFAPGMYLQKGQFAVTATEVKDHTSGSDEMLVVTGNPDPGKRIWSQTVAVKPGTDYDFDVWVTDVNFAQPSLVVKINGETVGSTFTPSGTVNSWTDFRRHWNAGLASSATIEIYRVDDGGREAWSSYGIDDIRFLEVCPPCNNNELQVNGDFSQNTGGWDYLNTSQSPSFPLGQFEFNQNDSDPSNDVLRSQAVLKAGQKYRVAFTLVGYGGAPYFSGDPNFSAIPHYFRISPEDFSINYVNIPINSFTAAQNNVYFVDVLPEEDMRLLFYCYLPDGAQGSLDIDNISIKALCGEVSPVCKPEPFPVKPLVSNCTDELIKVAYQNAEFRYKQYIEARKAQFQEAYINKCLDVYERFQMSYEDREYHYTLYYYDQAGNLVRTIPPKGVKQITDNPDENKVAADMLQIRTDRANNTRTYFTEHTLATTYTYNSLNQLVAQQVPDNNSLNLWDVSVNNNSGIPSGYKIYGTQFTSATNGYLIADDPSGKGRIYLTDDAGKTWNELTEIGMRDINDVQWISPTLVYAIGADGSLLVSSDGGNNWVIKPVGTTDPLIRLYFTSDQNGMTFEGNGVIWKTTNAGDTWTSIDGTASSSLASILRGVLTDVHFYDAQNGMATSDDAGAGYIYKTADGGQTWIRITSITAPGLNAAQILPGGKAFLAGEGGTLLASMPNGTGWARIGTNLQGTIQKLHFLNNGIQGCAIVDGNFFSTIDGGITWNGVNTNTGTGNIVDMYFYGESGGYSLTSDGNLLGTSDGGANWTVVKTLRNASNQPVACNALYFSDADNGYVGGVVSDLYVTSDATTSGGTWQALSYTGLPANLQINDIHAASLAGKKIISVRTSDLNLYSIDLQATTPQWKLNSFTPVISFQDMSFADASTGYAQSADATGAVAKTIDGGWTWTPSGSIGAATQTLAAASNAVYAAGPNGTIYKYSPDANNNWTWGTQTTNVQPQSLKGVYMTGTSSAYACGTSGTVLKMTDGAGFTHLVTGNNKNFTDLAFTSPSSGTVAGEGGFLLSTTNGGTSWTTPSSAITQDIQEIVFVNSGLGYLVGKGGAISKYNGSSWAVQQASPAVANDLRAVSFFGNTLGLAAGTAGMILKTQSSSNTWAKVTTVDPLPLKATFFLPGTSIGYAVGRKGTIVKTTDNGATWQNVPSSITDDLNAVFFTSTGQGGNNVLHGVAAGTNGKIYETNDGATWTPVIQNLTTKTLNHICIASEDPSFWIIAGDQVLLKTEDNGKTFTAITGTGYDAQSFRSVYIVDKTTMYVTGTSGTILKGTSRGTVWKALLAPGATDWTTYLTGSAKTLNDVWFRDYMTGYVIGDNATMLKTVNGGDTWVSEQATAAAGLNTNLTNITSIDNHHAVITGDNSAVISVADMKDEFTTRFWYDRLGRLVASQNGKQFDRNPKRYSYTLYDGQGRVYEVGEVETTIDIETTKKTNSDTDAPGFTGQISENKFNDWVQAGKSYEITHTYYDAPMTGIAVPGFTQENLRKRVASVIYQDEEGSATYQHGTHYSYDIHGNVKTLVQENTSLASLKQQFKRMDYTYDLISGTVLEVSYQRGAPDRFYHRYEYDADNRITNVYTSRDSIVWDQDGKYFYYDHGPLARMEVGEYKVQGLDYAYTIQGWIKGVNSNTLQEDRDMGQDGSASLIHANIGKDEFGYTLGYFNNDYKAINPANNSLSGKFEADISNSNLKAEAQELFNGNIRQTVSGIRKFMADANQSSPDAFNYRYDQLNRLVETRYYMDNNVQSTNTWASDAGKPDFRETFGYDPNGNIISATRTGVSQPGAPAQNIDVLSYKYETVAEGYLKNTNQLRRVSDAVQVSVPGNGDLPSGQQDDNYTYDAIGNLSSDIQENIASIQWTVYGKVKSINRYNSGDANYQSAKGSAPDLEFAYDAQGNRVMKLVKPRTNGQLLGEDQWVYTYYARDAQGNVLATYERKFSNPATGTYTENFNLKERHIYGSSRLGVNDETGMPALASRTFTADVSSGRFAETGTTAATYASDPGYTASLHWLGRKSYELADHLGNVRVVLSDAKVLQTSGGLVPNVLNYYSYYAFGMAIPGRSLQTSTGYRFGFNGKEMDNELHGTTGTSYDYGFRIYDSRLGRFLSVDPLTKSFPFYTPYQFAGNKPIWAIDLDGLEEVPYVLIPFHEAPKLKKSEWYSHDRTYLTGSFVSAAKYNTEHLNSSVYAPVNQIHAYYLWASQEIDKGKSNIKFFEGAAIVTSYSQVGGAYHLDIFNVVTGKEAKKALAGVNSYLLEKNMPVIKDILNGKKQMSEEEALKWSLNYVQTEQQHVEDYLQKNPLSDEAKEDINYALNKFSSESVEQAKKNLGVEKIDFSIKEHRVAIGQALMKQLYKKK